MKLSFKSGAHPQRGRWVAFALSMAVICAGGGESRGSDSAIVDAKLPSKTITLKSSHRRVTYVFRVAGNTARTNVVCAIWEEQVAGRWAISSRDFYVGERVVLTEEDIDSAGIARKMFLHNGDELVGVLRKRGQISGVVPQAEIEEIREIEKSGTAAGAAIGSIIGAGKNGPQKTPEEIMQEVSKKHQELEKNAQPPK